MWRELQVMIFPHGFCSAAAAEQPIQETFVCLFAVCAREKCFPSIVVIN